MAFLRTSIRRFRRRGGRIYRRRRFRTTRVQRSRRIFRRFIRRRAAQVELKYQYQGPVLAEIPAANNYTNNAHSNAFVQNTGVGARVGNQIKFVKVDFNIQIFNNSATTLPLRAPAVQSAYTRILFWTPRVAVAQATDYMTNIVGVITPIDFTVVTVLRDVLVNLSPPYMAEATTNDIAGGPFAYSVIRHFKIPHPRKVKFASANINPNNTIDPDTHQLYFTIVNSSLDTRIAYSNKIYFIDA